MKKLYRHAVKFLHQSIPAENPEAIIASYTQAPAISKSISLAEIFERILGSAQNTNMKVQVIGGSIGGYSNLKKALFNFNPKRVKKKFENSPDELFEHIVETLNPSGKLRTTNRSIWPKYCQTILSASNFLSQFRDGEEFMKWATAMYKDTRTMAALPLIVSEEIEGIGYALACDFLKELGFINYGKPDVHVKDIFCGVGLCSVDVH